MMAGTDPNFSINSEQFSNYISFYKELVPDGEMLTGGRAREFFMLSHLPIEVLNTIWQLSDVNDDGMLDTAEFAVALHLTQLCLSDVTLLPPSLPPELKTLIHKVTHPVEYIHPSKNNQVLKCQSAFLSFCENVDGNGYLTAEAARYLLTNSQLSKPHLFHIWILADEDKDGRLSFEEFVIAMHLIFIAKLDQPLPIHLQNMRLLPEEFSVTAGKIAGLVAEKPSVREPSPPPPSIPLFVVPTEYPCIRNTFKELPPEEFKNGKFDSFIGNPFTDSYNNTMSKDQYQQMSRDQYHSSTSSIQSAHSESADISKLSSSSRHSSAKSLVAEHDEPIPLKAQSVDVEESNENIAESVFPPTSNHSAVTPPPRDVTPPIKTTPTPPVNNTPTPPPTISVFSPTHPLEGRPPTPPLPSTQSQEDVAPPIPPPPPDLDSDDEECVVDEEAAKAELEEISRVSNKFLSENQERETPRESYQDPYADAPEMKTASQKGLAAVITDISNKETPTQTTPTETRTQSSQNGSQFSQNGSQSSLDFLAQLEGLEAEIMNVLDDTNSFDPNAAVAPPPNAKHKIMPVVVQKPSKPHTDEPDSPNYEKKSNTLPSPSKSRVVSKGYSSLLRTERRGSARTSSDSSSEPSPSPRRYTVCSSPVRKKFTNTNRNSALLDDLDDMFSAELASIDNFLESKQSEEKKAEERRKKESIDVKMREKKAMETPDLPGLSISSVEELAKKREEESARKLNEWKQEMKEIEVAAQKQYEDSKKVKLSDEEAIKELESEWEALLEQESKNMKEAWVIREQKQRERERLQEEMRRKILEEQKKEVTIEEWIKMMEENKMKEMTPEERKKYEERKKAWLQHRKEKEERHKREMEEKLQRNREKMAAEIMRVRDVEKEVKEKRVDSDKLKELEEEQLKREAEERKQRSELAKQRKEESKMREIEESKSKAKSAIAARWEKQVKERDAKDYKSTVLTSSPVKGKSVGSREEGRLAKRFGDLK